MDKIVLKQRALRFFFAAEIIVFTVFYIFGSNGMQQMIQLQKQQEDIEVKITQAKCEVAVLNKQIADWEASSFCKEKVAREQLQMAREGDEVYYIA